MFLRITKDAFIWICSLSVTMAVVPAMATVYTADFYLPLNQPGGAFSGGSNVDPSLSAVAANGFVTISKSATSTPVDSELFVVPQSSTGGNFVTAHPLCLGGRFGV